MPELGEPLSGRELDVLECVVQGASNKEIAAELSISQNTVKVHLRRIYTKMGVNSRTEATTAAIQQGLVTVPGMETAVPPTTTESGPPPLVEETEPPSVVESNMAAAVKPTANEVTAVPESRRFNWWTAVLILVLVLSIVIIILLSLQFMGGNQTLTPTTATPFSEKPIGDTSWLKSQPMPEERSRLAAAAIGLDLYAIGGQTAAGATNAVSRYDTSTYTWHEMALKPTAVSEVTAAVLYGEVYVPGGRLADGQPTNVVEAYSPANDAWRSVKSLPQSIAGGLVIANDGFLYLFGGWDGENYLDTVYEYNPALDSWRPLPPMPQTRAYASGGALTGQLYVVGGYDGENELAVCEAYDPTSETWTACPDMLLPRAGAGAAVLLNRLYVVGGGTSDGLNDDSQIEFSEEFTPDNQTWHVVNTPALDGSGIWSLPRRHQRGDPSLCVGWRE